MLDRVKVVKAFEQIAHDLFLDMSHESFIAKEVWRKIVNDPLFIFKVKESHLPWLMPTWEGRLDDTLPINLKLDRYTIAAVDGSQIYPDRHQGAACYLINIGYVLLKYGVKSEISFSSVPFLFTLHKNDGIEVSIDTINSQRESYELQSGVEMGKRLIQMNDDVPYAVLFDGSLIFWHLESKETIVRERFLSEYITSLEFLYRDRVPVASYISLPKSKELSNLIRASLCEFDHEKNDSYKKVEHLIDAHVVRFFLKPYHRTIVFHNRSTITKHYPDHLKPCFFYVHCGQEIGRIEVPRWVAKDGDMLQTIASIVVDQSKKGRGYPVCLAEAHEQAVVKGQDREFFYHILQKAGIDHKQRYAISQKQLRKRGMNI